jgi:hypothetical protein
MTTQNGEVLMGDGRGGAPDHAEARQVAVLKPLPGQPWTSPMVLLRLTEALGQGGVLQRLAVRGLRPEGFGAGVDVVRDFWEAYGRSDERERPIVPSAEEIDRSEEAIRWLLWLEDPARRLVAAKLRGVKERRLENQFYVSRETLRKRFKLAIALIVGRLNGAPV